MYLCTTISMSEGISISMLVTFLMPIWLACIFSRLKKKSGRSQGPGALKIQSLFLLNSTLSQSIIKKELRCFLLELSDKHDMIYYRTSASFSGRKTYTTIK